MSAENSRTGMGHSDNALTFLRHNIVKSGTGRYFVKKKKKKRTRAHLKIYQKHSSLEWNLFCVGVCVKFYLSHEGLNTNLMCFRTRK